MKSLVFGLGQIDYISEIAVMGARSLIGSPHPKYSHYYFAIRILCLLGLFSLTILDCPKVSLLVHRLGTFLQRWCPPQTLLHHANTFFHKCIAAI